MSILFHPRTRRVMRVLTAFVALTFALGAIGFLAAVAFGSEVRLVMPTPGVVDGNIVLNAICEVEGGTWGKTPGGAGCMMPATWGQHTKLPYDMATNPRVAAGIYRVHIKWLAQSLQAQGDPVTPETLALTWRYGLTAGMLVYRKGDRDYGQRVANLYAAMVKSPTSLSPP